RVVSRGDALAGDIARDDARLILGYVREGHHAGRVPDRPHPLRDAAARVDRKTPRLERDADDLERGLGDSRLAPGGDDELTRSHAASIGEPDYARAAVGRDGCHTRPEAHIDAFFAKHIGDELA